MQQAKQAEHAEQAKHPKQIKHVVSLGTFCHTANHFQLRGIRTCSHPFDWILSRPSVVTACLRDDFQTFLDPVHHQRIGADLSNHRVYGKMVLGNNFHGKLPLDITFTHRDITNPTHYAYYERCVQRFRDLMKSSESKLFVLTTQDVPYDREEIKELHAELQARTTNFHLLCISFFNDYHFHTDVEEDGDILYMRVYTYSRSDGRGFAIPLENDYFHDAITKRFAFTKAA